MDNVQNYDTYINILNLGCLHPVVTNLQITLTCWTCSRGTMCFLYGKTCRVETSIK
jgi:hypothetical protein